MKEGRGDKGRGKRDVRVHELDMSASAASALG